MAQALPLKQQAKCSYHQAAKPLKSSLQTFILFEIGGTGTDYYGNCFNTRAGAIH